MTIKVAHLIGVSRFRLLSRLVGGPHGTERRRCESVKRDTGLNRDTFARIYL
jgi:hypothetical protein